MPCTTKTGRDPAHNPGRLPGARSCTRILTGHLSLPPSSHTRSLYFSWWCAVLELTHAPSGTTHSDRSTPGVAGHRVLLTALTCLAGPSQPHCCYCDWQADDISYPQPQPVMMHVSRPSFQHFSTCFLVRAVQWPSFLIGLLRIISRHREACFSNFVWMIPPSFSAVYLHKSGFGAQNRSHTINIEYCDYKTSRESKLKWQIQRLCRCVDVMIITH